MEEMELKNKNEAEHHVKPNNCEVPEEDQDKFHQSEEVPKAGCGLQP